MDASFPADMLVSSLMHGGQIDRSNSFMQHDLLWFCPFCHTTDVPYTAFTVPAMCYSRDHLISQLRSSSAVSPVAGPSLGSKQNKEFQLFWLLSHILCTK
jgi:hypothetical protein